VVAYDLTLRGWGNVFGRRRPSDTENGAGRVGRGKTLFFTVQSCCSLRSIFVYTQQEESRMDYETSIAVLLVILILYFSLDFDKYYGNGFQEVARHPFYRFLAGLCVLYLASINPILAILALVVVFFWIADVHLLSSFQL